MGKTKIKLTYLKTGDVVITDDFYIFEEEMIRELDENQEGYSVHGGRVKVKFIHEK